MQREYYIIFIGLLSCSIMLGVSMSLCDARSGIYNNIWRKKMSDSVSFFSFVFIVYQSTFVILPSYFVCFCSLFKYFFIINLENIFKR